MMKVIETWRMRSRKTTNRSDRERGLNFSQLRVAHFSRFGSKLETIELNYWSDIEEAIAIELAIFGR